MKKFVLHLLALSHSYVVPSLKRECIRLLEQGWLTKENVVDVLQLATKCDAPRLALVCMRMVVRDFKCISSTEGWKVMKRANPALEQQLLEALVEADSVCYQLPSSLFECPVESSNQIELYAFSFLFGRSYCLRFFVISPLDILLPCLLLHV